MAEAAVAKIEEDFDQLDELSELNKSLDDSFEVKSREQSIGNESRNRNGFKVISSSNQLNESLLEKEDDDGSGGGENESIVKEEKVKEDEATAAKAEKEDNSTDITEKVEDKSAEIKSKLENSKEVLQEKKVKLQEKGNPNDIQSVNAVENEIDRINGTMQKVQDWNFVPVPKKRQKTSGWRKFWTGFTNIASKVTKAIVNVVTAPIAIYKKVSAEKALERALARADERMQAAKKYDAIPGWDGANFEKKGNEKGEDILEDERRVPTVWSYLTAGKAEDSDGNAVPPEVTVYIAQPVAGSSEAMKGSDIGHAMVGINYSRYSNITKRYERYGLKYGFYPAGGFTGPSFTAMMANAGAILPGMLMDDREHAYSISRRYPATMEQVGKIVKASETYASGGYGYYKRNCTTFVRDMVAVEAGITGPGDDIFQEDTVGFNASSNILSYGGGMAETYMNAGAKNNLVKYSKSDDMSYQGFGNKRVTKGDVERYRESIKQSGTEKKGLIPALAGENLRLASGENAGELSSFQYAGSLGKDISTLKVNIVMLKDELFKEGQKLQGAMKAILTPEQIESAPNELQDFIHNLPDYGGNEVNKLCNLVDAKKSGEDGDEYSKAYEFLSDKDIKDARISISDQLDKVGRMYATYFKGDQRLDTPVMNFLSLMQLTLNHLDSQYDEKLKNNDLKGDSDIGNMYGALFDKDITVYYETEGDSVPIGVSASMLEAYMQIYKNRDDAVANLHRYNDLSKRKDSLKGADKREFEKLERVNVLAQEFDKAHRYMLERKDYSQQDIDYAFSLGEKERSGKTVIFDAMDEQEGNTAAGIYQSLILEDIFGGMRESFLKPEKEGGISSEAVRLAEEAEIKGYQEWLYNFLEKRIEEKSDKFGMVITGAVKAAGKADLDKVKDMMYQCIGVYLRRAFTFESGDKKANKLIEFMHEASLNLVDNIIKKDSNMAALLKKFVENSKQSLQKAGKTSGRP